MHVMMAVLFNPSQLTVAVVPTNARLLKIMSVVLGGRATGRLHVTVVDKLIKKKSLPQPSHHNVVERWLLSFLHSELH